MFGGRKKGGGGGGGDKKDRSGMRANLSQFGLMDVPGVDDMGNLDDMLDDDGDDLEAELQQIMSGGGGGRSKAAKPKKRNPVEDLDAMVASCMKDYDSNEELSDSEDPDLLAELQEISPEDELKPTRPAPRTISPIGRQHAEGGMLGTIQERLSLYRQAEKNCLASGESSRARRFTRGIKTLVDLEKKVKAGKAVNEDDIPPMIAAGLSKQEVATPSDDSESVSVLSSPDEAPRSDPSPLREVAPAPVENSRMQPPPVPSRTVLPSIDEQKPTKQPSVSTIISQRREELKTAALAAKKAGDKGTAINYMRAIKVCDALLEEVEAGNSVDLSNLPSLGPMATPTTTTAAEAPSQPQAQPRPELARTFSRDQPIQMPDNPEEIPPPDPAQYGAPPPPKTIMEALQQRHHKYKSEETSAKESDNGSKARRMGRICKQYENAMKLHKAGKPFPRDELPDPPGFGPIPATDAPSPSKKPAPSSTSTAAAPSAAAASSSSTAAASSVRPAAAAGSTPAQTAKPAAPQPQKAKTPMSLQDEQLMELEKRQTMFKQAALQAKKNGQMDTAKEYLKQALSFNKLINASKGGLPVEMKTLPTPPQMQVKTSMDFEIVSTEDCQVTGDREEMFGKLEQDLIAQVKMCMNNRTYFKEVGEIASSNKFEQMALHSKKDLDAVRFAFKRGEQVPKFHYEVRSFSKVQSCTDLTDNDLELTIVSGVNYVVKNPKDVDTYVKWEFPFPRDAPTSDYTQVVKDTNNPAYDKVFKIVVNPRDKGFQRIVKRGNLKVEIWSKGGFLRSDTLIGTATVKLSALETKCEVHDSYDLYEGRKSVGGKVEVKMRLRNPVVSKQIEVVQEKWLVVSF